MPTATLEAARAALQANFGYDDFRPAQLGAVEAVLSGRDALIVLPTGGGKSLCFQVPALAMPGTAVVVSPLISLMVDQVEALQARGVAAEFLNSTLGPEETARRLRLVRGGAIKLLYVAPERLILPQMLDLLKQIDLSILAVDEAHCVSEWGHDFRPSYLRLREVRRALGTPQTVALTATATPQVRRDVSRLLELRSPVEILAGFDRPNLKFGVERVRGEGERLESLVRLLKARRGPAVVYAATRRQVNDAAALLTRLQIPVVPYHAGLSAERRSATQSAFMSGAVPIIVATNAFGMGIDKRDVRLVVHYAPSGSLEDYYQEAGRAGRDGAMSRCVLLYHDQDRGVHDRFREVSYPLPDNVRRVAEALTAEQRRTRLPALDERQIGARCRPSLGADAVQRCVAFLTQHGIVAVGAEPPDARVRLLASPLRLACELPSLDDAASLVLASARDSADQDWCRIRGEQLGLSPFALKRALGELESRQLVFVDRPPPRFAIDSSARGAARLDAAIRLLTSLRIAERAKLDAVVAYATTRRCRRDFILRYFGDMSPRSKCGRCDNCS